MIMDADLAASRLARFRRLAALVSRRRRFQSSRLRRRREKAWNLFSLFLPVRGTQVGDPAQGIVAGSPSKPIRGKRCYRQSELVDISAYLPDSRGPAAESPREHERELPACGAVGRGGLAALRRIIFRGSDIAFFGQRHRAADRNAAAKKARIARIPPRKRARRPGGRIARRPGSAGRGNTAPPAAAQEICRQLFDLQVIK